jgi:3-hydroxyacyl-CoA dehydrogenase
MGSGIAQVAATKGIDVILLEVSEKAVKTGIDAVERRLSAVVTKGKMTPAEKDAALRRIKARLDTMPSSRRMSLSRPRRRITTSRQGFSSRWMRE